MDENKIVEKMRMLKLQETVKIIENKIGKQADKREWEQALLENKVSNVKYMGKAEIDGEMGDSHVGLQARLMSQALRKLAGAINKSKTVIIFITNSRYGF